MAVEPRVLVNFDNVRVRVRSRASAMGHSVSVEYLLCATALKIALVVCAC